VEPQSKCAHTEEEKDRKEKEKREMERRKDEENTREIFIIREGKKNNSLGTNRVEWEDDGGGLEIIRDFEHEPVDNLSRVLGELIEEIPKKKR